MDIDYCPNKSIEYYCFPYEKSKGFTELMMLVMQTKRSPELLNQIEKILKINPEIINEKNDKGYTALMLASINSTNETISLLIKYKADLNLQSPSGFTALTYSCLYNKNNNDAIRILVKAGAKLNLLTMGSASPLNLACQFCDNEIIELLINAGADLNHLDSNNRCALSHLIGRKNGPAVQMLIEAGVNIGVHKTLYMTDNNVIKHFVTGLENLTYKKNYKQFTYKFILKQIPMQRNIIRYSPGNMGSKISELHFNLQNFNTEITIDEKIINYLGIYHENDIMEKISQYLSY